MKTSAEIALGISQDQIEIIYHYLDKVEIQNNAIGLTKVRHEISERLIEIRLLLAQGYVKACREKA